MSLTIVSSGGVIIIIFSLIISNLGFSLAAMQCIKMVNGTLGGRPRVGEDLEDMEIVAQSVGSHQQHSCKEQIKSLTSHT